MEPVVFAIAGGGWRSEFFLRVARELPERFRVGGLFVRNAEKAEAVREKWGAPTFLTLDETLRACSPAFVVTAVPWPVNSALLTDLAGRGVPVLSETPPAPTVEDLVALHELTKQGARIQVAEQYQFQPEHAARLAIVRSGLIGEPAHAFASVAHGYHGVSMIRLALGAGLGEAAIRAKNFDSLIVQGSGRSGPPQEEKIVKSVQTIAWLEFAGKLGVYDFTGDQYFSWIRAPRMLIRGERGEIDNDRLRYLRDFRTPIETDLVRSSAGQGGNLEGCHLKGILAGGDWVFRNPYAPARLSDEEIALAVCLDKMAVYAAGGEGFYGLPEASQDHYLAMKIAEAASTGREVIASAQPWTQ